jgi:hypothetical protein
MFFEFPHIQTELEALHEVRATILAENPSNAIGPFHHFIFVPATTAAASDTYRA